MTLKRGCQGRMRIEKFRAFQQQETFRLEE